MDSGIIVLIACLGWFLYLLTGSLLVSIGFVILLAVFTRPFFVRIFIDGLSKILHRLFKCEKEEQ